jgi:preprotein translocase subunit SecF
VWVPAQSLRRPYLDEGAFAMFNIVKHRYWYFLFSALIVVPGIIAIIMNGVPRSIDFTGGSFFELQFENPPEDIEGKLIAVFAANGFDAPPKVVTATDPTSGAVRHQITAKALSETAELRGVELVEFKKQLYDALRTEVGAFEELQFSDVGPTVGAAVSRTAGIAVMAAATMILLYLTLMFRNVPHPVRYGICAITAMLHDVLIVVGLAAIFGWLYGWEVDALFLTALLTVIGFSVHDTIVVFDRVRENVGRLRGVPFERVVNHSIIQTLDRSINTQLTAFFTLFAIFIYSQGQLKYFVMWLLIGIVSGTYSSIFNAAPLLVVWENREWNTWFGRGEKEESAAVA